VSNVSRQSIDRAPHLPAGTVQKVTIDVRGQGLTPAQAQDLKVRIQARSNNTILARNINFLW
jgi:hypothetical protein